ncbi:nicotinate-nucleotide adenylyltransferase [Nitrosomonas sp.]|uniref:nicotinate-nucleotide adenylyltransferase n=1 Tax=Nitrosomonas sp. TaxID=42353 RepID=UPI0025F3EEA5|nr:nicotinate-nucleotide adenylyltransferase [Nitrosomonas sp.]MBE7527745.1 nicotinate-nucleotide adenylyltransferase [Burkholderiales bacterium]
MAEATRYALTGIYGGTFDPIHYGHLRIAEELSDILQLNHLFFLPAGQPRLRNAPLATGEHRLAMLREAICGNDRFSVDDREIRRPGETYSVETLQEIRLEYSTKKLAALCFIIGADAFIKLPCWHHWRDLFELCHLVIVNRPGSVSINDSSALPDELRHACQSRWTGMADELKNWPFGRIFTAPTSLLDISSTKIRNIVTSGKSARYLLPESVLNHIDRHHLYAGEK